MTCHFYGAAATGRREIDGGWSSLLAYGWFSRKDFGEIIR
jgi:hypothetical protein